MSMIKTYSELSKIKGFKERFLYLKLKGQVGVETFGFERHLNQSFYHSYEWKTLRDKIIIRDNGCDLGVEGYSINGPIIIHHINPINKNDLYSFNSEILNPENLICVSLDTHNAIHYGDESILQTGFVERSMYDTCHWRIQS